MWDGEYAVGLQHLKSYEYLPEECEQMREICDGVTAHRIVLAKVLQTHKQKYYK
jgi:hypothetical protein